MLVFWEFGALICIVAFLITDEVSSPELLLRGLGVDSSGRGLLTSVLPPLVPEFFLLFLPFFLLSRLRCIVT